VFLCSFGFGRVSFFVLIFFYFFFFLKVSLEISFFTFLIKPLVSEEGDSFWIYFFIFF
jgi:hypothetical protein